MEDLQSLKELALELNKKFKETSWYSFSGIGKGKIIIYVKSMPNEKDIIKEYKGHSVEILEYQEFKVQND